MTPEEFSRYALLGYLFTLSVPIAVEAYKAEGAQRRVLGGVSLLLITPGLGYAIFFDQFSALAKGISAWAADPNTWILLFIFIVLASRRLRRKLLGESASGKSLTEAATGADQLVIFSRRLTDAQNTLAKLLDQHDRLEKSFSSYAATNDAGLAALSKHFDGKSAELGSDLDLLKVRFEQRIEVELAAKVTELAVIAACDVALARLYPRYVVAKPATIPKHSPHVLVTLEGETRSLLYSLHKQQLIDQDEFESIKSINDLPVKPPEIDNIPDTFRNSYANCVHQLNALKALFTNKLRSNL